MNSTPEQEPTIEDDGQLNEVASRTSSTADTSLPEVHPPSAGFILQLFVIPMVIVAVVVSIVLLFNMLATSASAPELVRNLKRLNEGSWQDAFNLSLLLQNPDNIDLKQDKELAAELISVLRGEIKQGKTEPTRIRLRMFVCKCLGEFMIEDPIDPLIDAALHEQDLKDLDVRRAAIESLALLINNIGPERLVSNRHLEETLIKLTLESSTTDEDASRDEIMSAATYALGILGSDSALETLRSLTHSSHSNTRYNAATGLARHGDLAAKNVLLEMLDPDNPFIKEDESKESLQVMRRDLLIGNALRDTMNLADSHSTEDMSDLIEAMKALESVDVSTQVGLAAKEAVLQLEQSQN